jgi:mRNA interferase HigB
VHVITRKRLNEFVQSHPDALSALDHWYRVMKSRRFSNFAQLREAFPSADQVDNKTVFNIGGNKYRLIAAFHYNRARVYIRAILTHRGYDKGTWKNR